MTTLPDIVPGDIWLAYVFFSDKSQTGKVHPILVAALTKESSAVIAAKITTSPTWPHSEYVFIPNWPECGLRRPSYVQLNPLLKLSYLKSCVASHWGIFQKNYSTASSND